MVDIDIFELWIMCFIGGGIVKRWLESTLMKKSTGLPSALTTTVL